MQSLNGGKTKKLKNFVKGPAMSVAQESSTITLGNRTFGMFVSVIKEKKII